jgi:hypothetical protein
MQTNSQLRRGGTYQASKQRTQLQAATEAQRWLKTLQGQRYFIGLHLGDEATQITRTNFSEYTLNPPTNPRSLSVKFEYTLYIKQRKQASCSMTTTPTSITLFTN